MPCENTFNNKTTPKLGGAYLLASKFSMDPHKTVSMHTDTASPRGSRVRPSGEVMGATFVYQRQIGVPPIEKEKHVFCGLKLDLSNDCDAARGTEPNSQRSSEPS